MSFKEMANLISKYTSVEVENCFKTVTVLGIKF